MITKTLEDGTEVVVSPCTQSLGNIQQEKQEALKLTPTLDINPCSSVPLAELLSKSTTD